MNRLLAILSSLALATSLLVAGGSCSCAAKSGRGEMHDCCGSEQAEDDSQSGEGCCNGGQCSLAVGDDLGDFSPTALRSQNDPTVDLPAPMAGGSSALEAHDRAERVEPSFWSSDPSGERSQAFGHLPRYLVLQVMRI